MQILDVRQKNAAYSLMPSEQRYQVSSIRTQDTNSCHRPFSLNVQTHYSASLLPYELRYSATQELQQLVVVKFVPLAKKKRAKKY